MSGDGEDILALLAEAERARGHARSLIDERAARSLRDYANELEAKVAALRKLRAEPVPTLPKEAAAAPTGEPETGPELIAAIKSPPAEDET